MNVKRTVVAATIVVAALVAPAAWMWRGLARAVDVMRPAAVAAQGLLEDDCRDNELGPNGHDPNKQLFWGELHLHTGYSLDAFSFGTRTTPDQAYLYARRLGDVELDPARLPTEPAPPEALVAKPSAPLDFVAITDHSEFLSVVEACSEQDAFSPFWNTALCQRIRDRQPEVQEGIFDEMDDIVRDMCDSARNLAACLAEQRSAWVEMQRAAHRAYRRCEFTSFIGYEWSAQQPGPGGVATNHRNVIFASANVPFLPFSFATHKDPPALWRALDTWCTGTCRAVTIPHNINLSGGLSLDVWDKSQRGLERQQRYQVSAEIYQHKGASECHYDPNSAAFDESECAFEQLDKDPGRVDITRKSFVRHALGQGLIASLASPRLNPFKLGFVGGTDGHNGAPGNVEEDTWRGHDAGEDDTPYRRLIRSRTAANGDPIVHTDWGPGGITGVWAQENSREAIFAAIRRRETYATSGPRIRVRVLQTTNATACTDPNYPGSVVPTATPMGGTFTSANLGGAPAPTFLVGVFAAGANQALVRLAGEVDPAARLGQAGVPKVQIIKIHAHMTATGPEVVTDAPVDVVAADPNHDANFDPATGGCLMWTDQNFDSRETALYYVRVLQEPTFRWSYKDCLALAATPEGVARGFDATRCQTDPRNTVEERAWTSPIWYEPPGLLSARAAN